MSSLQIEYSKEIAKELGKIAVYLPGEHVEVGDIITFPNGKSLFGKSRPLGSFKKVTSLKKIGVEYDEPTFSNSPDSYRFSSKNVISFDVNFEGEIVKNDLSPNLNSKAKIHFSSKGAMYFLAIECDKKQLDDLASLENKINITSRRLVWEDTYLVTSITVAKKALIIQSQSKNSEILINGDLQAIKSEIGKIDSSLKLNVQKQSGDVFLKDWSKNVTVFMDLIRFEKEVFDSTYRSTKPPTNRQVFREQILLKPVKARELLID